MWDGSLTLDRLIIGLRICPAALELPTPHAVGVNCTSTPLLCT